jgi:hypothetical protein
VFGGFDDDEVEGNDGDDVLDGDIGENVPGTDDECDGGDGFDLVTPDTCEDEDDIEGDLPPEPEE